MTDYIATRWYRAPEILFSIPHYEESIDVWSFGCLMGELMKGKAMFPGTSTQNQLEKILSWTGMPTNKELKEIQPYISKETVQMFKPKTLINKI
jgi:mitogen-activated protein kinase 15